MDSRVRSILEKVRDTADFGYVEFTDVNDTNELGANALHCVAVWGDCEAATLLIEAGIRVNQPGELGETPLDVAELFGHNELIQILKRHGGKTAGAPKFDRERHNAHLRKLGSEIERLEIIIDEKCSGNEGALNEP